MVVVAAIGIFTAILAASIAFTQTDIKRVLAYSTLSQLGYMFAALGVGAYIAAIFHLVAHGFFKGLLFLDSGSVIHAVHDEQDMNRMGGLASKIPITTGRCSSARWPSPGIPPLAGFFSKDEILSESFKSGFYVVWAIGVLVALHDRVLHVPADGQDVLWPEPRRSGGRAEDPRVAADHDGAADPARDPVDLHRASFLGLPLGDSRIRSGSSPVFQQRPSELGRRRTAVHALRHRRRADPISVAVAVLGMVGGWYLFGFFSLQPREALVRAWTERAKPLYTASFHKWYFDDLNDLLFVRFGSLVAASLWWFDRAVIDGTVNGVAHAVQSAGSEVRHIQTGRVQNYALGIAAGLIVLVGRLPRQCAVLSR